jgi:hypothetical protein
MPQWPNVREYLELTVGKVSLELALTSLLIDSFHPVCINIKKALDNCTILERKSNIIYLKPFRDIFVTSPENEISHTCVLCGKSDYLLEEILDKHLITPDLNKLTLY